MPRVLTRAQSTTSGQAYFNYPVEVLPSLSPTRGGHPWFGNQVNPHERERIIAAASPLVMARMSRGYRGEAVALSGARLWLSRLLDWLDTFPGESYQDRWIASNSDDQPQSWCPALSTGSHTRLGARLSINALILLGVIRPGHEWLIENKQARFYRDWTTTHEPDAWDRYFDAAEQERAPEAKKWGTATHLVRISIVNGLPITAIRSQHVIAYRNFLTSTGRTPGALLAMWHYGRRAGLFAGEADDLRHYIIAKRLTPAELVDRFNVQAPTVRRLLIAYLAEIAVTQDYGSLDGTSRNLVKLFWKPIEEANPGIDTINLTKAQAAEWKNWLRTKPDGTPRRHAESILGAVRSFYLDIAAWAHEDPAAWATSAVSCPVSVRDVQGQEKRRAHRAHRMQARTRTLAPHIDALVAAAEQAYREATELQAAAQAPSFGAPFTVHGTSYIKHKPGRQADQSRVHVVHGGSEKRLDTQYAVTRAFMTWTIIEILRHTGIRIEELLELTHVSIKQYRKPDSTVLPLLQIAPSKTDQERVFPCSPDLTAALARLVTFVSIDDRVPLCCRVDRSERVVSAPMPHLLQFREAGRSRVIHETTVQKWLTELANSLGLADADGTPLHFTPHDFRRIFITDIVNAGFPIHLAAKIVGHNNIEVTRGYTAVYQKDVFDAYERFIDKRRQARPSAEYREPTEAEWDEFIEHFGQRKIALGNCHRPYGADCVHEHACIRCDFCQVDPSQLGRLDEIRDNLHIRVKEAQRNQWLGDVNQLRITIEHADRKAERIAGGVAAQVPLVVAGLSSRAVPPD
ncbi:site-specific recombinase XerD (plasmid) [Mycobacterium sp. JS623]|uniref:tyrosine-type recombinase/integrase n=1 Tax=Mycobacterium sp. JS623 TaxID=212767 RepID=UPI0002A5A6B4|nr:tyrosine-type recombinase/integrase [Mycobacterium sp. JS623]AGB26818.1 site-specific recombinase XerD [Mycobacterium sp. JS623]